MHDGLAARVSVALLIVLAILLVVSLSTCGERPGEGDGAVSSADRESASAPAHDTSAPGPHSARGPHSGYITTTGRCEDCHTADAEYTAATAVASRQEDACTWCHVGGGGSVTNVLMDNVYDHDGLIAAGGMGTGHTMGYRGLAAAGQAPAYASVSGLACLDCHTPHGESARAIATIADPGRTTGSHAGFEGVTMPFDGVVEEVWRARRGEFASPPASVLDAARITAGPLAGMYDLNREGVAGAVASAGMDVWGWSPDAGNVVVRRASGGSAAEPLEVFGDSTLMLLKDPGETYAPEDITVFDWTRLHRAGGVAYRGVVRQIPAGEVVPSTATGFLFWARGTERAGKVYAGGPADDAAAALWKRDPRRVYLKGHYTLEQIDSGAVPRSAWQSVYANGVRKLAIDWDEPMGPAAAGAVTDQNVDWSRRYAWAGSEGASGGIVTVSEFCAGCHDGAAGASTQPAEVYLRSEGGVVVGYGHDAQPRAVPGDKELNPGGWVAGPDGAAHNSGPYCRECHAGAGGCESCHGGSAHSSTAWQSASATPSASTAIGGLDRRCIDAGFNWPHRTLGMGLLADELYGVDFDGAHAHPGDVRTVGTHGSGRYLLASAFAFDSEEQPEVVADGTYPLLAGEQPLGVRTLGHVVANFDAVCIGCHGDATFWNPVAGEQHITGRRSGEADLAGFELLFKGLP